MCAEIQHIFSWVALRVALRERREVRGSEEGETARGAAAASETEKARGAATLGSASSFSVPVNSVMRRADFGHIESVSETAELGEVQKILGSDSSVLGPD